MLQYRRLLIRGGSSDSFLDFLSGKEERDSMHLCNYQLLLRMTHDVDENHTPWIAGFSRLGHREYFQIVKEHLDDAASISENLKQLSISNDLAQPLELKQSMADSLVHLLINESEVDY